METMQAASWPRVITGFVLIAIPTWPAAYYLGLFALDEFGTWVPTPHEPFLHERAWTSVVMDSDFLVPVLWALALALLPVLPVWGRRSTRLRRAFAVFVIAAVPAWPTAALAAFLCWMAWAMGADDRSDRLAVLAGGGIAVALVLVPGVAVWASRGARQNSRHVADPVADPWADLASNPAR